MYVQAGTWVTLLVGGAEALLGHASETLAGEGPGVPWLLK